VSTTPRPLDLLLDGCSAVGLNREKLSSAARTREEYPMAEFSVAVSQEVGCLDGVADRLAREEIQIESLACLCGGEASVANFSVPESARSKAEALQELGARETGSPVLHIKVPNELGCLSRVTSAFSQAGVNLNSLACACAAGDESGIVAVGLRAR
jgi:hypothetical protein